MIRYKAMALGAVAVLLFCDVAHARMRPMYEDAVVVERSELILVAHLKEYSIRYIPLTWNPNGVASSWEHHATLVITEVIKGRSDKNEIPVVIHYGLTPVVGGYAKRENFTVNLRGLRKDYPKNIVEILDTGNSAHSISPLVKDAREDNLWFLRRRSGTSGRKPWEGNFGIVDPEDLRPIELKSYFLMYLSQNPEPEIREYLSKNKDPAVAWRAQRYLDHMEIQRLLKEDDATKRLERLLPYYAKRVSWNGKQEARDGTIACGQLSGPFLLRVFDDPQYEDLRPDVILVLKEIGYTAAAPKLADLLRSHNNFCRSQKIYKDRWCYGQDEADTRRRGRICSEVYYSVCALRTLGNTSAIPAVRETRQQWLRKGFETGVIVEECDKFLKRFAGTGDK